MCCESGALLFKVSIIKNSALKMISDIRKNYYYQSGKPVHRLSYCAFLDVLGFSDRIEDSFKSGKEDFLLQEFHGILKRRIDELNRDIHESLLYMKAFTDNIILAHPQFTQELESEFAFILWPLSEFQFEMAKKGFFIRGGLSVGPLYIDEDIVYGPALLEAYKLENSAAVNPIVSLSDDVMELVLEHIRYYSDKEDAPQNRDILVNSDGRFFINYLSECYIDNGTYEEIDWKSLKIHKDQLEVALNTYRAVPKVFSKYTWLAAYHNHFCDSVSRYDGYSKSLNVSTNAISIQFGKVAEISSIKNNCTVFQQLE